MLGNGNVKGNSRESFAYNKVSLNDNYKRFICSIRLKQMLSFSLSLE